MKISGLALVIPGLMLIGLPDFAGEPLTAAESDPVQKVSPLHRAAPLPRDVASIMAVLDRGERLDGVDLQGRTTLMWAAQHGHLEIVRRLIEQGVDLHVRDWWGRTALSMALENGHREIVSLLVLQQTGVPS